MRSLADLSDDELLAAAGPGATLENGEPPFGSSAWFVWMDLHFPARPDSHFTNRRQREPGEAGPQEWVALEEYLSYVEARGIKPKPGMPDLSDWRPYRGPTGEYRCPECDCPVEAGAASCGGCAARGLGWPS